MAAFGLVEGLFAQAAALGGEDLGEMDAAGLGNDVRRLRAAVDRIEAEVTRRLAAFEQLDGPRAFGMTDLVAFLQFRCGMDVGPAVARAGLAKSRETLPSLTAAADSGRVSFDQAAIIARGASEVAEKDARQVEQRALAAALDGMAPGRLRHFTKAVVAEVDNKALERDARRAHEKRAFHIGRDRDGLARVEGYLESEVAAMVRVATDAQMGPKDKSDERTAVQRRHDALKSAFEKLLAGGSLPRVGRQRPHITVVAPLSAMLGEEGPPALLQGLVPIPRADLMRLAEQGSLSATLVDRNGREVYSGKARTFSAPKLRSMLARSGTCEWPDGCDRPTEWCDGHHRVAYAEGGVTAPHNGEAQCAFHHALNEKAGWAMVTDRDGIRKAVPPGDPENPRTPYELFAEASRETKHPGPVGPALG
ncbi:MAG: DUF222 domain-containing protein [Candidatus Dormibacteria bacterium]